MAGLAPVVPTASIGSSVEPPGPAGRLSQSAQTLRRREPVAFSSKTEYGLVALIELAAIHSSGAVLQVAEIAARQSIPDRYLEQMLTSLRRGGILRSIRGPKGGYQLVRPPAEVLVSEVVSCLEGDAVSRDGIERRTPEFQVLHGLAGQLESARLDLLQGTTLQQLLERRDALFQAQAMYFI